MMCSCRVSAVSWWIISTRFYREEKLLRHVSMAEKFLDLNNPWQIRQKKKRKKKRKKENDMFNFMHSETKQ